MFFFGFALFCHPVQGADPFAVSLRGQGGFFSSPVFREPTMRLRTLLLSPLLLILAILFLVTNTWSWGFFAHKEVHRYAVLSVPDAMQPFFAAYADSLIARSMEPDQRAIVNRKVEGPFHFIDIDRYGKYPFSELPRRYEEAVKKYGKETVDSNGTVPWRIQDFTEKLTKAMREKHKNDILFYASNLGHYIADAHVPLHSVENYDGQLSDQKGVHARWESRLPEMFRKSYELKPSAVEYVGSPLDEAFLIVLESNRMVDSVLSMDLKAREGLTEAELFKVTQRRGRTEYQFSDVYYGRYHELLGGMVERRMQESIKRVASYWYTAWVDAGKPHLGGLK
ncbi:MAG TPA: S1/P1 Nuclease [Bacteroidetes bacterium]|nr:S1/P1 Nuclease [Bacteroidota bacterium]